MPVYNFHCKKCDVGEEVILPVANRNDSIVHKDCGEMMQRLMSLPLPAIFIQTARGMALDSINNGGIPNNPKYKEKAERAVMQGFERNRPMLYSGF